MVEIYKVPIYENLNNNLFSVLLQYVSDEKAKKIQRFKNIKDKSRSLVGDLLLRYIIMSKVDIANREIIFTFNDYGKPILNNYSHIHFNLSHAGNWVVVAFDSNKVGIDIEYKRPINLSSFKSIFSEQEYEQLKNLNIDQQMHSFYKLWTIKESYVKMIGEGLSMPLNNIEIENHNCTINNNSYFKNYEIDKDHFISCSATHFHFPDVIQDIKLEQLFNSFIK